MNLLAMVLACVVFGQGQAEKQEISMPACDQLRQVVEDATHGACSLKGRLFTCDYAQNKKCLEQFADLLELSATAQLQQACLAEHVIMNLRAQEEQSVFKSR